jgi:hypothetical protein
VERWPVSLIRSTHFVLQGTVSQIFGLRIFVTRMGHLCDQSQLSESGVPIQRSIGVQRSNVIIERFFQKTQSETPTIFLSCTLDAFLLLKGFNERVRRILKASGLAHQLCFMQSGLKARLFISLELLVLLGTFLNNVEGLGKSYRVDPMDEGADLGVASELNPYS